MKIDPSGAMLPATLLATALAWAAPADEGQGVFIGHYGTIIGYPKGLSLANVVFGDEGDELLFLADGKSAGRAVHVLRVASRKARPKDTSKTFLSLLSRQASEQGVRLEPLRLEGAAGYRSPEQGIHFIVRETPEYLFQVNSPDKAVALALLDGIKQVPREEWDQQVVADRRKRLGEAAFIPDLEPPKTRRSKLGYTLKIPASYAFHVETHESAERVYLFPIRHGVLMHEGILEDASEYGHFRVLQLQALRHEGLDAKQALKTLAQGYSRGKGLTDEDFEWGRDEKGRDWMSRRRPTFLKHIAWSSGGTTFVVIGAYPKAVAALADMVTSK